MNGTVTQFSGGVTGVNSSISLITTGNYLLELCAPYSFQAAIIAQAGGGGTVSPVNPTSFPSPIEFIVANSGTFMVTGESSIVIHQFAGYNIMFNRNFVPQTQVNDGNSYFTWDKNSGLFTVYGAANLQELFSINAI